MSFSITVKGHYRNLVAVLYRKLYLTMSAGAVKLKIKAEVTGEHYGTVTAGSVYIYVAVKIRILDSSVT